VIVVVDHALHVTRRHCPPWRSRSPACVHGRSGRHFGWFGSSSRGIRS